MGLLSMIRKMKSSSGEYRILILGLDAAGKTTLLKALANEDPTQVTPTEGFNIKTVQFANIRLNVWDLGGQRTIREFWDQYYENTDGIIYVIDSGDSVRVQETCNELNKLLAEPKLQSVPLLIFANKQDMEDAVSGEELSDILNVNTFTNREYNIQACVALDGTGVQDGVEWLVKIIEIRKQRK